MAHYNLIYDFKHTLVGESRLLNDKGNKQTITLRLSSQEIGSGGRNDTFVVQLQAQVQRMWFTVKMASFPRNGMKEVKWTGMAGTSYRLRMEKSTDDVRVIGVGVLHN